MKHLIRDIEIIDYLEGNLNKDEIKSLKERMSENGELDLLYHLELSYYETTKEYADFLIGEDDFVTNMESENNDLRLGTRMAASIKKNEKKDK